MTSFAEYAEYYDLLYEDKDYVGESRFVTSRLAPFIAEGSAVLDLGCGTGLHALEIARQGYRVDGIDRSAQMVALAERRRAKAVGAVRGRVTFNVGEVANLSLLKSFDAAVSLFHVMSYIVEDTDLVKVARGIRNCLSTNAPFLFDFWYGPAVEALKPSSRCKVAENASYRVTREAQPHWSKSRHVVQIHYRITVEDKATGKRHQIEEDHELRYFFEPELLELLQVSGFRVLECREWLSDRPPSTAGFGAYILALAQ